jgi:hypothetical protein
MTHGNTRKLLIACLLSLAASPALAQKNVVTCTGTLIEVDLKLRADWPLAVIYDTAGHYTCIIDRDGAGRDPLRPCNVGEKCRVVGSYSRKIGHTYSIRTLTSVDAAE